MRLFSVVKSFLGTDDVEAMRVSSDLGVMLLALLSQWPHAKPEQMEKTFQSMKDLSFKAITDILCWEYENRNMSKQSDLGRLLVN